VVEGGILARPPLNLLIDPNAAKRKSPWEIHISELLDMFLEAIMKSEFLDLRAAGTAALTSATIYRFKVESLFLFEKLRGLLHHGRRALRGARAHPRGDSPQRQGGEHGLALPPGRRPSPEP
jgi:hypothetical protein